MPKTKLLNQARLAACLGVDRGTIWEFESLPGSQNQGLTSGESRHRLSVKGLP